MILSNGIKGGCVLKKLVESVIENLSTGNVFLFRVTCENCGSEYGNRPIRFSKSEIPPDTQSKQIIYSALYEQELQDARRTAIRTAAEHMNYCPICKRLFCNKYFRICDDLDMCKQCASDLKLPGNPVLVGFLEAKGQRKYL